MPVSLILRAAMLGACSAALSACLPLKPEAPEAAVVAAAASAASAPAPAVAASAAVTVEPPPPLADATDLATRRLLAYHEQLRQMPPAELGNEIARLSGQVSTQAVPGPATVIELAMALSVQHNPGDATRAAALLEPLLKSGTPELQPWLPMARLISGRVNEQRRLEDLVERGNAQRREQQRSLQQLNEKLEALKAIERSMPTRPGAAAAPASAAGSSPTVAPAPAPSSTSSTPTPAAAAKP